MKNAVSYITPGVGLNIHPPSPLKNEKILLITIEIQPCLNHVGNSNPNDDPALIGRFISCPDHI